MKNYLFISFFYPFSEFWDAVLISFCFYSWQQLPILKHRAEINSRAVWCILRNVSQKLLEVPFITFRGQKEIFLLKCWRTCCLYLLSQSLLLHQFYGVALALSVKIQYMSPVACGHCLIYRMMLSS